MPSVTSPGGVVLGGGTRPGVDALLVADAGAGGWGGAASASAESVIATAPPMLRATAVGDRTLACRRNVLHVLRHDAARVTRRRRFPLRAPSRELVVSDVQLDQQPMRVDRDR